MAKFPTMEEFAKEVAEKSLDDFEYEGKTIREWAELVLSGKLVEVVRCAQCKYQRDLNRSDWYEGSFAEGVLWCLNQSEGVSPEDFCSYGERRTDG